METLIRGVGLSTLRRARRMAPERHASYSTRRNDAYVFGEVNIGEIIRIGSRRASFIE